MLSVRPDGGQPVSRKLYDPLAVIPSPEAIRERLTETLTLAERLRILLDVAERLRLPLVSASDLSTRKKAKGAGRG
jgi:hypothetical protein